MAFVVPQYVVAFYAGPANDRDVRVCFRWLINGDDELDAICRVLRLNGINDYSVSRANT